MKRPLSWLVAALSSVAFAGEKPAITYKPPPTSDEERPLITEVVLGTQGTDYAFKIEFNKEPADGCGNRCANATLFLDTDNNKKTGLRLNGDAPETGADLALTIQGGKLFRETASKALIKVKLRLYAEGATQVDQGRELGELDPTNDPERVLLNGTSVYVLLDANIGELPSATKARVVYHPPESKALVGTVPGLSAGGRRPEIFKDGKISNPVVPRKKTTQSL